MADSNEVQAAADKIARLLTPAQAADFRKATDSKQRKAVDRLAAKVNTDRHRLLKPLFSHVSSSAALLLFLAVTGNLRSCDKDQGEKQPQLTAEQQEIERLKGEILKANETIMDLSKKPPIVTGFDPNISIWLQFDPKTGRQTAYLPGKFLLQAQPITLQGSPAIPFDQALEIIGDYGQKNAITGQLIIASQEEWRSSVSCQVDERLLQSAENRTLFMSMVAKMKENIDATENGFNGYFYFVVDKDNKAVLYRDPGAPGGADMQLVPLLADPEENKPESPAP